MQARPVPCFNALGPLRQGMCQLVGSRASHNPLAAGCPVRSTATLLRKLPMQEHSHSLSPAAAGAEEGGRAAAGTQVSGGAVTETPAAAMEAAGTTHTTQPSREAEGLCAQVNARGHAGPPRPECVSCTSCQGRAAANTHQSQPQPAVSALSAVQLACSWPQHARAELTSHAWHVLRSVPAAPASPQISSPNPSHAAHSPSRQPSRQPSPP